MAARSRTIDSLTVSNGSQGWGSAGKVHCNGCGIVLVVIISNVLYYCQCDDDDDYGDGDGDGDGGDGDDDDGDDDDDVAVAVAVAAAADDDDNDDDDVLLVLVLVLLLLLLHITIYSMIYYCYFKIICIQWHHTWYHTSLYNPAQLACGSGWGLPWNPGSKKCNRKLFFRLKPIIRKIYILVGGFNPSEKYESVGMIIPNIWKNKCLKPTRFSTCLKDVSH